MLLLLTSCATAFDCPELAFRDTAPTFSPVDHQNPRTERFFARVDRCNSRPVAPIGALESDHGPSRFLTFVQPDVPFAHDLGPFRFQPRECLINSNRSRRAERKETDQWLPLIEQTSTTF